MAHVDPRQAETSSDPSSDDGEPGSVEHRSDHHGAAMQDWTRRTQGVVDSRRAQRPTDLERVVLLDVARHVQQDLVRHQTTLLAAGIAFRGFLALFPALIVAVAATALVQPAEEIVFQARRLMAGLPARGRELIIDQVEDVVESGETGLRIALVVSIVLAVWTVASALQGTITALTTTHGEVDDRSWWKQRQLALKLTAVGVPFGVTVVGIITGVPLAVRRAGLGSFVQVLGVIGTMVALSLMMVSGLTILYRFGADRRAPRTRWAIPGAVAATVVWLAGSEVLKLVTENFGDYDDRYGVAAGVAVLLLWLWLTAWCVLFGSTLNARLEHQTAVDSTVGTARPLGDRGAVRADTHPERSQEPPGSRHSD